MAQHVVEDDDRDSFVDNTKEIVNISGSTVRFELHGVRYVMKPGEKRRVHGAYASDKKMAKDRDRVASTVELLTNNMVLPIDHPKVPAQYKQPEQVVETKAKK